MFRRRRYDWHLERVERINTILNHNAYHSSKDITGLCMERLRHIKCMNNFKEKK